MSATGYDCERAPPTAGFGLLYTGYSGENDGRSAWSPVYDTSTSRSVVTTALVGAGSSSVGRSSQAAASAPTTAPAPNPHPPSHVGAIAGGVVGGLAVLAALTGGLIFMCLRKRKNNDTTQSVHQPTQEQQQQQQYPPPEQQHQQHYSPPSQQYQQYPQPTPTSYIPPPEQQQTPTTYPIKEPMPVPVSPQSPAPPYGFRTEQAIHAPVMSELPTSSSIPTHSKEGHAVYEAQG
jgi:hypothetical protein